MPDGKPNILILWGDDIGWFNISHNNRGVMGYQTPNIDRIARGRDPIHRLLRPAELHRRAGGLHYRPESGPYRADQGGVSRGRHWPATRGPDHCRFTQAPRLRHRAIW